MEREKLRLTPEEAREILWNQNKNFKIIKNEIVDTSRWSVNYDLIVQRISDGKFFNDGYSKGATESQDEMSWEFTTPDFTEVFPVEKTIVVYE